MYATSDRQTDGRTTDADDRLMPPPPLRGRGIINDDVVYLVACHIFAAGHDSVRLTRQCKSLHCDELRRQQRRQQRSANRIRLVPAARNVSTSGHRYTVLLRCGDARPVG